MNAPSPARYRHASHSAHARKLARPRGTLIRMNSFTTGSSKNAMMNAMMTVMKKTRP